MDERRYNQHNSIRYTTERIIYHLIDNNEIIWKILKYDTNDALFNANLTRDEKIDLIYKGGDLKASGYKVFRQPYIDDAESGDTSMLRVFLSNIIPQNKVVSDLGITIECLVHNKNIMLKSNLDGVSYENRLELLLQQVIECLNGAEVSGIGQLFFDMSGNYLTKAVIGVYNNRNYHGFRIVFGSKSNIT